MESTSTQFEVRKPEVRWIANTNGQVQFLSLAGVSWLTYGLPFPSPEAGILFACDALNLKGYTNHFTVLSTQIGTMLVKYVGTNNGGERLSVEICGDGESLDSMWPYIPSPFGPYTFASWPGEVGTSDSPAFCVQPDTDLNRPIVWLDSGDLHCSFEHYIYFQPSAPSIPVALKRISWELSMSAINSGESPNLDVISAPAPGARILAIDVPANNPQWTNRMDWFGYYMITTNWFQ